MYRLLIAFIGSALLMTGSIFSQTGYPKIDQEIAQGNFSKAQEMIRQKISGENLDPAKSWELELQSALLDRIRLDFNRNEAYVRKTLAPYYPELTDAQLQTWESTNELEMRIIDGEKRYFRNAVWNLFRINQEAGARKREIDGTSENAVNTFLATHLPKVVEASRKSGEKQVLPQRLKLHYTLRVKPDVVPEGEMIRAWLPFPRSDRDRLIGVQLLRASEAFYMLSPLGYPHSSIYMEKEARKGEWTEFDYEVEYTAYNEWHDLKVQKILPYDTTTSLYQYYTAERDQHVRFTPELQALSQQIVGNAKEPLEKAWRIYEWIGKNIPWASALEYSTMPNIPAYCIANKSGDCGMKGLLFITLCRYNGIPAKWQSGWYLYPDETNLHDWTEVYFEGPGWIPMDPDFNLQDTGETASSEFFFNGADAYRLIVNDDFSGDFFPAKIHHRSETVDFQRGEVEWKGGNLYFDQWRYKMEVEYLD